MGLFAAAVLFLIISVVSVNSIPSPITSKLFKQPARGLGLEWWQTAVFYQIYPRSFKDSDNDGNGDLQGIIQKLDHIQDAGVDAIWLSPIFKSPQVDNGYDISDYRDIDELYGTLEDLRQLVDEAHGRDIKVILDYVPNHTSDQHKWFQASVKKEAGFEDFYVWKDAVEVDGKRSPPNNWISAFKNSAWEWNDERQQYYLHQFSVAQPDLNYRNPDVVKEMKDVLLYWLNFGIDGFRMDAVSHIFEDDQFQDEPLSDDPDAGPDDYNYLDHIYTKDRNETFDLIYDFRDLIDEFSNANNSYPRIIMTESYSDINTVMLYYGSADYTRLGAHIPFNFWTFITQIKKGFTSFDLVFSTSDWWSNLPPGSTDNWVLGNHDQSRVATRLGTENIDALNMYIALLPGVQVTYNGEEIGQENGEVTCQQGYDPQAIKDCTTFNQTSRDFERTPFQWNSEVNGGFNEGGDPWLPVSQKYVDTNLEAESVEGVNSHYNIYKQMQQIRQEYKHEDGYFVSITAAHNYVVLQRFLLDTDITFIYFYNIGDNDIIIGEEYANSTAKVVVKNNISEYEIGDSYDKNKPLKSKEAVVFKVVGDSRKNI